MIDESSCEGTQREINSGEDSTGNQIKLLVADAADGNEGAVVLKRARRYDSECNVCCFRCFFELSHRFDEQGSWRRIRDLVEDSEVNGGNVVAVFVTLQDLTQDVLHDLLKMTFV